VFISDFSIRKPIVTIVVMLALVVFGIFALLRLEVDEFPEVNPPFITVAVLYPGASPDQVEREVIQRIEDAIASIAGVDKMNSQSVDSFGLILVEFIFEKDARVATQEIRDKISEIRNELPAEMEEPILKQFNPSDFPIVSLSLTSSQLSAAQLTQLADPGITREFRGIKDVAEVNVIGGVERELTVELRPSALQTAGVSVGQVVSAVQAQNLAVPVGRLQDDLNERTIRLRGRLDTPQEFAQIVVGSPGGRIVRLGDVADVRDGSEEPRTGAAYNGAAAVGIEIKKTTNASTTTVSEAVISKVDDIQDRLPPGVELRLVRDAGTRVANSVRSVQSALVEGALLTVFTVFLFLNSWRSTVITGLALPVSVLASFMAVLVMGYKLETMSLLGLTLAIGIIIDDAIVVRENIVRHVEMGKDHYTAAREGTSEIGLAVAATTWAIVVVFLPIAFMGGIAQRWFAPFALTMVCSVLVSLFVSFSLDPMLSAYWPEPHTPMKERSFISRGLHRFNMWFERQAERYKKVIGWALRHRFAMVVLTLASFAGALALPALGIVGGGFFPVADNSEFGVVVNTPPGSNIEYTKLKSEEAAAIARSLPEVAYTYTTIGGQTESVDEGNVYVRLVPRSERTRRQDEVAADLRDRVARLGGVEAWINTNFFGAFKQIQLQLTGPDSDQLAELAERIREEVRQVPGAVDVGLSTKGRKPELDVEIDRGMAGALGVTVGQVAQALRPAFAGIDVGDWVDPDGETRDVYVRLAPESRRNVQDLSTLPLMVQGPQGQSTVPLGQIARISTNLGPARIDHFNRDRVINIEANTYGRSLTEVVGDIERRLVNVPLPPGYRISQGGETADQQEVFGRMIAALGLAIMLMYFVLVLQFGSFLDPLAIMISLPLSLIGVMLALLVTGSTLNLMSMIGVVLLMGLVAKNAILLIDFAKSAMDQGAERKAALIEAGRVRLRPILMTSFALIAGMLPVAIGHGEGADFRAPLGRAVIGGLITSTVLTLLVIPTIYDMMASFRDWIFGLFRRGAAVEVRHPDREPITLPEGEPVR
jgi:hydrophobic/amphiphilic exporter-1 (mainly G- bacteria), HAE1 family